jgi:hypothetical protein
MSDIGEDVNIPYPLPVIMDGSLCWGVVHNPQPLSPIILKRASVVF